MKNFAKFSDSGGVFFLYIYILDKSNIPTLIGGDFNMKEKGIDDKIEGSSFSRIPLADGATTYRNLSCNGIRGATIDHILGNFEVHSARVSEDGLFTGDHFPVLATLQIEGPGTKPSKKIKVKPPPTIKAGDKGGLRRLQESLKKRFNGDLSEHTIGEITDWTVAEQRRIAASRAAKTNPDGWSPTSLLLHIRLRILGALFKRLADKSGVDPCYRMYKDSARDITRITLNADEEEWLEFNGVQRTLPDWRAWRRDNDAESLLIEIRHLRSLTTRQRRDELRILHGGRMRRIQDEADAGKIGTMLKKIMAKSSSFSMEVLYGQDGNTTDPIEIARIVTEFFQAWFNSDHDDDARDTEVSDFSASGNGAAWAGLAERLGRNDR